MKNKLFKRIMSLVLVVVMAVSTMAVSAVSVGAANSDTTYYIDFSTALNNGKSADEISIKVNGDNGSTEWHNIGMVACAKTDDALFTDINVGNVQSITVKNDGSDGWYPEIINVVKDNTAFVFYGGRWVDDGEEVTFARTDRAAKVTVKTSDVDFPDMDYPVYVQLFDEEGQSSEKLNLLDFYKVLEGNKLADIYILVPENFGRVEKILVEAKDSDSFLDMYSCLDYIDVSLDCEAQRFYEPEGKDGSYIYIYHHIVIYPANYIYKVTLSNVTSGDVYDPSINPDFDFYVYAYNNDKLMNGFKLDNSKYNLKGNEEDDFYIITTPMKIDNIRIGIFGSRYTRVDVDYVQVDRLDISKGKEKVAESVKYNYCNNSFLAGYGIYSSISKEKLK